MRVESVYPSGPQAVPKLAYGARPIPMLMIHLANCGRNCGIRKGKPMPAALPKIEEDVDGEAREFTQNKSRVITFVEKERPRQWPSAKFKLAKQDHIRNQSPPSMICGQNELFLIYAFEDTPSDSEDDSDDEGSLRTSDSRQLQVYLQLDKETHKKITEPPSSKTPRRPMRTRGPMMRVQENFVWRHKMFCGPKCGQVKGKSRARPKTLAVIEEDLEGEKEESEDSSEASDSAGSDRSSPTSLSPSSSFSSTLSLEGEEVVYITSTSGLAGLGLLHMPELTSMSTISIDELLTPPESPIGTEMDVTDYHRSLVDEWRFRFAKTDA